MMSAKAKLTLLQKHSLSSVLEREIEGLILSGELALGSRINEAQIAERFGISRSPVREALRALEAAGLVEALPNRGIFVRRVDTAQALETYGVRAALFGYAGRLLAQHASDGDIARLQGLHAEMGAAAGAHRFDAYFPLNFAFHDFIVEASRNGVLAAQYRSLVKHLRLFRGRNLRSGDTLAISDREHEAIMAAFVRRDPDEAYRTCFEHVEMGRLRVMAHADAFQSDPADAPQDVRPEDRQAATA